MILFAFQQADHIKVITFGYFHTLFYITRCDIIYIDTRIGILGIHADIGLSVYNHRTLRETAGAIRDFRTLVTQTASLTSRQIYYRIVMAERLESETPLPLISKGTPSMKYRTEFPDIPLIDKS